VQISRVTGPRIAARVRLQRPSDAKRPPRHQNVLMDSDKSDPRTSFPASSRVEAVIVNHGTPDFAELALRSLANVTSGLTGFAVTVIDNPCDMSTADLESAATTLGARFVRSRWPVGGDVGAGVTTHGDVLRDFVLGVRDDAQYILFVDADVCFVKRATLITLIDDVATTPDAWAAQARQVSRHTTLTRSGLKFFLERESRSLPVGLRTTLLHPDTGEPEAVEAPPSSHWGTIVPRLSPACALVRNDEVFRRTVETLGLSPYWNWSADPSVGGYGDTFALATQVMHAFGLRRRQSRAAVLHFGDVSHSEFARQSNEALCQELLTALRADRNADMSRLLVNRIPKRATTALRLSGRAEHMGTDVLSR